MNDSNPQRPRLIDRLREKKRKDALSAALSMPANNAFLIGRSTDNDLVLNDPSVSRRHCILLFRGDKYEFLDLGSTHGVRVLSGDEWIDADGLLVNVDAHIKIGEVVQTVSSLLLLLNASAGAKKNQTRSKVFLCYRRADASHLAGRMYDKLSTLFGPEEIILDVDTIPAGMEVQVFVKRCIESSAVMLALIGPNWLHQRSRWPSSFKDVLLGRTNANMDWVIFELGTAIQVGIPVFPVLFDDAAMPSRGQLPPSIRGLDSINAVRIHSAAKFHSDMERIIASINSYRPEDAKLTDLKPFAAS